MKEMEEDEEFEGGKRRNAYKGKGKTEGGRRGRGPAAARNPNISGSRISNICVRCGLQAGFRARCNGELPCPRCVRLDLPCVYGADRLKGGKRKPSLRLLPKYGGVFGIRRRILFFADGNRLRGDLHHLQPRARIGARRKSSSTMPSWKKVEGWNRVPYKKVWDKQHHGNKRAVFNRVMELWDAPCDTLSLPVPQTTSYPGRVKIPIQSVNIPKDLSVPEEEKIDSRSRPEEDLVQVKIEKTTSSQSSPITGSRQSRRLQKLSAEDEGNGKDKGEGEGQNMKTVRRRKPHAGDLLGEGNTMQSQEGRYTLPSSQLLDAIQTVASCIMEPNSSWGSLDPLVLSGVGILVQEMLWSQVIADAVAEDDGEEDEDSAEDDSVHQEKDKRRSRRRWKTKLVAEELERDAPNLIDVLGPNLNSQWMKSDIFQEVLPIGEELKWRRKSLRD